MSETLVGKTRFEILFQTPTITVIRCWYAGIRKARPGWRALLAASALPTELNAMVSRLIVSTRLWRSEKAAVATELAAHFQDGLDAGNSVEQLIGAFGDERTAAKLIRRAKRRNRPLIWHAWLWTMRGMMCLLAIYLLAAVYFFTGKPSTGVDYVRQLNATISNTAIIDRAWPLWRQVILRANTVGDRNAFPFPSQDEPTVDEWHSISTWCTTHADVLKMAREASAKPAMGFVFGVGGSIEDKAIFPQPEQQSRNDISDIDVTLPHLGRLRQMAIMLSIDAKIAADQGDSDRCESDLMAIRGLARQLRSSQGFVLEDLVALGCDAIAVERFSTSLAAHPKLFRNDQLVRFAHAISGPQVAADLMQLRATRLEIAAKAQRYFTDDGNGNGRITREGLSQLEGPQIAGSSDDRITDLIGPILPAVMQSRREFTQDMAAWLDQTDANLHRPMRDAQWKPMLARLENQSQSVAAMLRYAVMRMSVPYLKNPQASCERYLGRRDGLLVGIALEIYHREHGRYPATLVELSPIPLPGVPVDRITGDPVKYRLIDGKPVVYSVGDDRVDNGGRPCSALSNGVVDERAAARWDNQPETKPVEGDWILYPPVAK